MMICERNISLYNLHKRLKKKILIIERIMSTCAICLSSKSNVSMLTAVDLNVIKLIVEALLSKIEEDFINLLH